MPIDKPTVDQFKLHEIEDHVFVTRIRRQLYQLRPGEIFHFILNKEMLKELCPPVYDDDRIDKDKMREYFEMKALGLIRPTATSKDRFRAFCNRNKWHLRDDYAGRQFDVEIYADEVFQF